MTLDLESMRVLLEIAGLGAVLLSLFYVVRQLKHGLIMNRAQIHQSTVDNYFSAASLVSANSSVLDRGANSKNGYESLSAAEKLDFSSTCMGMIKMWENAHYQFKLGLISEDKWIGNVNHAQKWINQPEINFWLDAGRRERFDQSFLQAVGGFVTLTQ